MVLILLTMYSACVTAAIGKGTERHINCLAHLAYQTALRSCYSGSCCVRIKVLMVTQ